MLSLYDLMLFFCFLLAIIYWWQISGQKTFALQEARRYCRQRGIQLLDQTLAFKTYRLQKDKHARTRLCRVYGFDFCQDGESRRQGEVILSGRQVLSIMLEDEHLEITQY